MAEGTAPVPAQVTVIPGEEAQELTDAQKRDPRFQRAREVANGEKGREMLEHARQGAELDEAEEYSGLDWLLGSPRPIGHKIPVQVETDRGMRWVEFVASRMDARKIDTIEVRHLSQQTGRIDRLSADCDIITEACPKLIDRKREVALTSEEFRTVMVRGERGEDVPEVMASASMALERRFRGQEGLLSYVATEIRRLAGYDPQRLGTSQRVLVEAALG